MLDVDAYAQAPGRDELIAEVRAKIDELGIDFIYYQYISITGRIMGKAAPAPHWEAMAEERYPDLVRRCHQRLPEPRRRAPGFPVERLTS